jgi:Antirestriction protein
MAESTLGQTSPASPSPSSSTQDDPITCAAVPAHLRPTFLPRVFGHAHFMRGEQAVYCWMSALCREYRGGFWDFVDLSNGGFYLRLVTDQPMAIRVEGNGFDDAVSADAAGIIATLFAINQLLFDGAEHLDDAYWRLLEFAAQHPERSKIGQAVD